MNAAEMPGVPSQQPAALVPLSGAKLVIATIALSISNFMVVLDTTVANVSVPTIAGSLAVSTTEGTWTITSYAVAEAIALPLSGWLAARFGAVRLFVVSALLFSLFSLLCGLAPSLVALVGFRILQGFAAGPLIPMSQTLLLAAYPREKSNIALTLWGMTSVVAPVVGPILGGWISDNIYWGWIFLINGPVGLFCVWATLQLMAGRETPTVCKRVDVVGMVLLFIWVAALQLMLDRGRELDWFASDFIRWAAVVAGVGFVAFLIWELTEKNPIVDLSAFRSLNFTISTSTLALMYGLLLGGFVLAPLWLQTQMGYTASWAGYSLAPLGVAAFIASPIVAKLMPKVDARALVSFGMAVMALSFFMRTGWTTSADFTAITVPGVLQGLGIPMLFIVLTSLGLSALPPDKIANGAGLQNFVRVLAGAVGAALTQTFWESTTTRRRDELVGAMNFASNTYREANVHAEALGLAGNAAISREVQAQAVMLATNDYFLYSGVLAVMVGALIWLARPPKAGLQTAAGH